MSRRLRFTRLWLGIGLIGCAVLAYASLMPDPPQPSAVPYYDKLAHMLAYGVLGAWFGGVLPSHYGRIFIGLAAYGLVLELVQSLTGYRSGEMLDMAADVAGIIAGLVLARLGMMRWLDYIDGHVFPARNRA